jgi:hypothetical protein
MTEVKRLMQRASTVANPGLPNRQSRRHAIAAMIAACGLAGCGWQPLYSRPTPDPASGGVGTKLAQIAVEPVESLAAIDPLQGSQDFIYDSHAAQTLQNSLLANLNPYGRPNQPAYHLTVSLQEQVTGSSTLANGQSTRDDVTMTARYQLTNEKGEVILTDQAKTVTSFDILYEPYADVASRKDALRRGAEELADVMGSRLAAFLRDKKTAAR